MEALSGQYIHAFYFSIFLLLCHHFLDISRKDSELFIEGNII